MAWKRTLCKDFCEYLAIHPEAWPKETAVKEWDAEGSGNGFRTGTISSLRNGKSQSSRVVTLVLNYILQSNPSFTVQAQREALFEFLRARRSCTDPAKLAPWVIVDLVSEEPQNTGNLLSRGHALIGAALGLFLRPTEGIRPCREQELATVLPWLYVSVGQEISGRRVPAAVATKLAESHVGLPQDRYHECVRKWMRGEPWTVVVAEGPSGLEAVSIAIPVTSRGYEEIRAGRRKFCDCPTDDIHFPSADVLVEAAAMKPRNEGKPMTGPDAPLARAVMCQHAHLTSVKGIGFKRKMRLLSWPNTPNYRKIVSRFSYHPIGVCMHETGFELYEREVQILGADPRTWINTPYVAVWHRLQWLMRKRAAELAGTACPLPAAPVPQP